MASAILAAPRALISVWLQPRAAVKRRHDTLRFIAQNLKTEGAGGGAKEGECIHGGRGKWVRTRIRSFGASWRRTGLPALFPACRGPVLAGVA